jgi:hypothetical protein
MIQQNLVSSANPELNKSFSNERESEKDSFEEETSHGYKESEQILNNNIRTNDFMQKSILSVNNLDELNLKKKSPMKNGKEEDENSSKNSNTITKNSEEKKIHLNNININEENINHKNGNININLISSPKNNNNSTDYKINVSNNKEIDANIDPQINQNKGIENQKNTLGFREVKETKNNNNKKRLTIVDSDIQDPTDIQLDEYLIDTYNRKKMSYIPMRRISQNNYEFGSQKIEIQIDDGIIRGKIFVLNISQGWWRTYFI